jgi:hypothetical protein
MMARRIAAKILSIVVVVVEEIAVIAIVTDTGPVLD